MPEPNDPALARPELDQLLTHCTFPPHGSVALCAVSGGPDSTALLALAVAADLAVTAVHVDHGLREDSGAEADIVAGSAARLGARFRAERVVIEPGADLEQRARLARHQVLGPDAMTGHTADDQAETLLINLLRGAGPAGLAAMSPGHRHPILGLRRADTLGVCRMLGLETVDDPSNLDPRFVRNRVRQELLPLLADISGRDPVPLLTRTADHARTMTADLDELAVGFDPTDTRQLQGRQPSLVSAALRGWLRDRLGHPPSTAELERVLQVVNHEVVACELSGRRRVTRRDGVLRVEES